MATDFGLDFQMTGHNGATSGSPSNASHASGHAGASAPLKTPGTADLAMSPRLLASLMMKPRVPTDRRLIRRMVRQEAKRRARSEHTRPPPDRRLGMSPGTGKGMTPEAMARSREANRLMGMVLPGP